MNLVEGQVYRRRQLHQAFGGQRQGGISTPPSVIMIFTGFSGTQNGYHDGWSDGVFCYFGEGQIGDMPWVRGNRAIRDHQGTGRDLLLFEMLDRPRSHVRFMGPFAAASWEYRQAPDRAGNLRRAIVFHLKKVLAEVDNAAPALPFEFDQISLADLRQRAIEAGFEAPRRDVKEALVTFTHRAAVVRAYALARAAGVCEACEQPAPFQTPAGQPFLEVHHINRLADAGPDTIDAVAAICPNCHREAHFGSASSAIYERLSAKISRLEAR